MKNIFTHGLSLLLTIVSATSFAQTIEKDSIQVNKYLKEADKSKTIPRMFTITDTQKVIFISNYIDAKNRIAKERKEKEKEIELNLPGVRYKNGDNTVVPEIIAIFKGSDVEKKNETLNQMEYDYDPDEKPHTIDPEIANLIFAMVNDTVTEASAVQYLGYNHIEGSIPVFEKRLTSGASSDVDRLFYWIAEDEKGQHDASIDFIKSSYQSNPNFFEDTIWITSSLGEYLKRASEDSKNKILEIAYDYIGKNIPKGIVPERESDSLLAGEYYRDFYTMAVKYGKRDRVKPLLIRMLQMNNDRSNKGKMSEAEVEQALDVLFIKDLIEEKQKNLIVKIFITPDMFFDGIEAMQEIPALANDPDLVQKAFKVFEFCDAKSQKDTFVNSFIKLSEADFKKYAAAIRSESLRKELIAMYIIDKKTFEQNNDELISLGLTNKKITDSDIADLKKKDSYFEKSNTMFSVLQASGISVSFDSESGEFPVDYSSLLSSFSENSQGKFGPFKSYLKTSYNKKKEQYNYSFLVICNNKCFVMVPEDLGDWYDMETFPKLIDALATDLKLSEKFVSVQSGDQSSWYIFGQPNKVNELIETYKLATEIPIDEK
jgi:hypothetical protein